MATTTTQSEKRLYIGNLATSVDEYSLMQVCAKYGKIAKLDYLFHKTGPNKGKPRGYAFVEYSMREVRPVRLPASFPARTADMSTAADPTTIAIALFSTFSPGSPTSDTGTA